MVKTVFKNLSETTDDTEDKVQHYIKRLQSRPKRESMDAPGKGSTAIDHSQLSSLISTLSSAIKSNQVPFLVLPSDGQETLNLNSDNIETNISVSYNIEKAT